MTREQFIEDLEEYEFPMTKEFRDDGSILLIIGHDKSLLIILHKGESFASFQSGIGGYCLKANIWYHLLELREIIDKDGDFLGVVVNDLEDEGASVAIMYR